MKIVLLFSALFAAALLGSQCHHPKYTATQLPDEVLRFGNGGGFTGAVTEYILLENGQLFKNASKAPEPMELACVGRKKGHKLFEAAESLGLLDVDFSYPGNMYYFVEFQDDGKQRRVTWGDREHPVDPKIKDFYDQLSALVADQK